MAEETKTNEPVATEQPQIEIKQEPVEEKKPQKPKKVLSEKQKEALKKAGREGGRKK